MPSVRFIPFLLTGTAILLCLTGALRYPPWRPADATPEPPPDLAKATEAAPDPAAKRLLSEAVRSWQGSGREWVQATVWMRLHHPAARSVGEGTYLQAPGGRYRLELRTRPDDRPAERRAGTLVAVGDGRDHWQATRTNPTGYRQVRRLRTGDAGEASIRDSLVQGPRLLVNSLLSSLEWVRHTVDGPDAVLVGVWPAWARASLVPRGQSWPEAMPRVFRLTLRGADRWPARVEWWGPLQPDGPDRLIAEVEFRDPKLGTVLPDDECDRLFRFEPGDTPVVTGVP
ncbi:MAG: hypothetical protein U0736_13195 [Gemmataceae bacterium]